MTVETWASPFDVANWRLEAHKTALILVDLQNDFLDETGRFARSGMDVSHNRRVIEPVKSLLKEVRAKALPVIWTRAGLRNEQDAGLLFSLRPLLREGGLRYGTWGWEISEDFAVDSKDWIVDKTRFSAFYGTNLEIILRGLNIEVVLIGGVLTNQCVTPTARDAFHRDIKPIVIEDCCGTVFPELHEPALRIVQHGFGQVRQLSFVIDEIRKLPAGSEVKPAPSAD